MKKQTTRRALVLSVLSLFVCVAMLIGTTFAWFTDSVTSGRNTIQSGNLDVELYYAESFADVQADNWTPVDKNTDAFGEDNWEPGFTKVVYFKVVNAGSLALKYQLAADVYKETAGINKAGESFLLSDYLYTAVIDAENAITREDVLSATGVNFKDSFAIDNAGSLAANAEEVVGFAIWMPTSVGNEANHNGTKPTIEFGINLVATQEMSEYDSFGNDYDKGATYPVIKNVTADAGDTITAGIVKVELPAEADEDNYTLKVDNVSTNTDANGDTTLAFDIELMKDGVAITPVAGVKYPVNIYVGENLNITDVKHKGVSVADFDYNSTTGIVSFETDSFSPFEVIYYSGEVAAENFEDLLVKGGEFTLTEDITVEDYIVIPEGKTVVLDLGGKTILSNTGTVIRNEGTLVIKGAGTIESTAKSYAIRVQKGKVDIDSADVNVKGAFGAVSIFNGAEVTINGGNYNAVGINGMTSHTIYVSNSTLTVNGGTFDSGYSSEGIDTICGSNSTIVLNNGTFYASELGASFFLKNVVVKGGTYQYDPTRFVAAGYTVTDNGDGTWTVGPYKVSTADELTAALAAGGKVKLVENIQLSNTVEIPAGVAVEIDLNGKNIGTLGSTKGCPLYLKGGKLTIKNGTLDLDGSETNEHGTFATAIGYDAQSVLVVENVTFTGQTAINGTFATNGPLTITVSNSTINTTNVGIAVAGESPDAIATVNNCNINAGKYAIFASQGAKITINGGTYKSAENVIASMYEGSVVTVNGGSFEGNLLITAKGALVVKGGTFSVDPTAYLASGYVATESNGTWTVTAN